MIPDAHKLVGELWDMYFFFKSIKSVSKLFRISKEKMVTQAFNLLGTL